MMLRKTALAAPALALFGLLVTACASGSGTNPSGAAAGSSSQPTSGQPGEQGGGELSNTEPPRLRSPAAPPSLATDQLPSDLIVGTITEGGSGPCYALQTDDGKQYALHGDAGAVLRRGAVVRVWFDPTTASCGAGIPVRIRKLEIVS